MNVKITVSIEDNGRTVESIDGEVDCLGLSIKKVYVNSSSLGNTEDKKYKTKEAIKEICRAALKKML